MCHHIPFNFIIKHFIPITQKTHLSTEYEIAKKQNGHFSHKNPLFNGASEFKMGSYLNYLAGLEYTASETRNKVNQIHISKSKIFLLFFDVGSPPKKENSSNYQSGPLSFEYFIENRKIITNCGFGNKISKKAKLISRLTSAQSTLCLNDLSVAKFERNSLINNFNL